MAQSFYHGGVNLLGAADRLLSLFLNFMAGQWSTAERPQRALHADADCAEHLKKLVTQIATAFGKLSVLPGANTALQL